MAEAFLKALKWYIMALSIVVGSSAFLMANRAGSILPWIVVVLGFGLLYIMSYIWTEFRGKLLIISAIVFMGLTIASTYSAVTLLVFFDLDFMGYSQYFMWGVTMLLGIPLMTLAFRYVPNE